MFPSEKAKRESVSSSLKTVLELQVNADHSVFWKKAGLEPPHIYPSREDQGSEMFSQEAITESSAMEVEESNDSNLFADI